jgi:hypothetical protein
MSQYNTAPLATAPPQPGSSGNPVVDIERAFDWMRDYLENRAPYYELLTEIVTARMAMAG